MTLTPIDMNMTLGQIKSRRLEIAVVLAGLAEDDCATRKHMLAIESAATALHRELAQLNLIEHENGWAGLKDE